jgi:hypothetical protein
LAPKFTNFYLSSRKIFLLLWILFTWSENNIYKDERNMFSLTVSLEDIISIFILNLSWILCWEKNLQNDLYKNIDFNEISNPT